MVSDDDSNDNDNDKSVVKFRLVRAPDLVPEADDEPTPSTVLLQSEARGLSSVIVLGYTPEGTMWVSSSGSVTRQEALWLLESAKTQVMYGDDAE